MVRPPRRRVVVGPSRDPAGDRSTSSRRRDASTAALPARWTRTDEWYGLLDEPARERRSRADHARREHLLPRDWAMGADHPIAWEHEFEGGRAWYTQGGHTTESYSEPLFLGHLLGGIQYALAKPTAADSGGEAEGGGTADLARLDRRATGRNAGLPGHRERPSRLRQRRLHRLRAVSRVAGRPVADDEAEAERDPRLPALCEVRVAGRACHGDERRAPRRPLAGDGEPRRSRQPA